MQPIDYAKAAGLAILVLMLDFAVAFLVVAFYSLAIDPGHPQAYYEAAALSITPWSTRVAGPILFFLAIWGTGRRRPERNPWAFALATFFFYLVVDFALVGFGFGAVLTLPVALTLLAKLAGALAGAAVVSRARRTS